MNGSPFDDIPKMNEARNVDSPSLAQTLPDDVLHLDASLKAAIEARLDVPMTRVQELELEMYTKRIWYAREEAFIMQRFHHIARLKGVPEEDLFYIDPHLMGDSWSCSLPNRGGFVSHYSDGTYRIECQRVGVDYYSPRLAFNSKRKAGREECEPFLEANLPWIEAIIEANLKVSTKLVGRLPKPLRLKHLAEIREWRDYPEWRLSRRMQWLTLQGRTGACAQREYECFRKRFMDFIVHRFYHIASSWGCPDEELLGLKIFPDTTFGLRLGERRNVTFAVKCEELSLLIDTFAKRYYLCLNGKLDGHIKFSLLENDYLLDSSHRSLHEHFDCNRIWIESAIRSTL